MRILTTGCAGFIGSQLALACLERGDEVVGVDALTTYYDIEQKRANLRRLRAYPDFLFVERDLVDGCADLVDAADVVFHQAGQPGVRASWREQFEEYLHHNVSATQRLLDDAVSAGVPRFVYASSSSVYGNAERYPVDETMRPQPFSPYGVTKLAGEHLCSLYAANFGLGVVSLRYFTVYGPGQRPDMATHRLFEAALGGGSFPLFGGGQQVRDFTYVGDVVRANLLAAEADVAPGLVANVAGGGATSMADLIERVEGLSARPIAIERLGSERGDVERTSASTDVARIQLGWEPEVSLDDGLALQFEWHVGRR